jgi:hypothetical protein
MRAVLRYRDGRTRETEVVDRSVATVRLAEVLRVERGGRRETRVVYRLFRRRNADADGALIYEEVVAMEGR